MDRFPPRPYLIKPMDAFEAIHGKAVILTDTMIAQIMTALEFARCGTEDGKEAIESLGKEAFDALWQKLFDAWGDDAPYEGEAPDE